MNPAILMRLATNHAAQLASSTPRASNASFNIGPTRYTIPSDPAADDTFGVLLDYTMPGYGGTSANVWGPAPLAAVTLPPFSDAANTPIPYLCLAQMLGSFGVDAVDRGALWYNMVGNRVLTYDLCRSVRQPRDRSHNQYLPIGDWDRGLPGAIRLLPAAMLDCVAQRSDGTYALCGTSAALAPVGWRLDGVQLRTPQDAGCLAYLRTCGLIDIGGLTSGAAAPMWCQLAFEYALTTANGRLLADFTVGPERLNIASTVLGGGSNPALSTVNDLCDVYVPKSWGDYVKWVLSSPMPTFAGGNLSYDAASLDAHSHAVAMGMIAQLQVTGRLLPASQSVPSAFAAWNFARSLRDTLHDGPSYLGTKPGYPDLSATLPKGGGSGLTIDWSAVQAGLAFVGAAAMTVASAGTASGVALAAVSLGVNALRSYAISALNSGFGHGHPAWNCFSGLNATLQPLIGDATAAVDVNNMLSAL